MSGFVNAVGFLTRVPVPVGVLGSAELARSVRWFPVVGALVGAAVGGIYALSSAVLPSLVAAVVAVAAGIIATGAFHEDGLGDVADSFGGKDPDDVVRILKDPRQGTFGVLAIGLSVLVRVAALASMDGWTALAVVPTAHAAARAGAVMLMAARGAGGDGLGAAYAGAVGRNDIALATAAAVAIGALFAGVWILPATCVAAAASLLAWRLARAELGGISGDFLGAAEQLGESGVFVLGAAIVHNAWPAAAWWR